MEPPTTEVPTDFDGLDAHFEPHGPFRGRRGAGWKLGGFHANKKLCFVATDKAFLVRLLLDLSGDPGCFYVKYSTEPRDGMHLGRCFMTDVRRVGELWARYHPHAKLMCSIQDDDFTLLFRNDGSRTLQT